LSGAKANNSPRSEPVGFARRALNFIDMSAVQVF
jgi:hypothetical protein